MHNYRSIFYLLIFFLINNYLISDQWESIRGTSEGLASIKYKGNTELNEWHYIYKSGRRYKQGFPVWASPAIAVILDRPYAFIGGYDQTLHCLDIANKKVIWRKLTNAPIISTPAIGNINGVDVVFFGSSDRTLYAYVAYTGRLLWTKELILPSPSLGEVYVESPCIVKDKIYVSVFAFDKSLPNNKQTGMLFILNKETGEILKKIQIVPGFINSPVGFNFDNKDFLILTTRKGLIKCIDVSLIEIKTVWEYQMPHEVLGTPVITTKTKTPTLYLGSKFGNFVAINALNGKIVWKKNTGDWIDNSACIGLVKDKLTVFVGSYDYNLYAFSAESGDLLWKKGLGGEVYSAPCFLNLNKKPVVAVSALDNHLYLIDAETGQIVTAFFTGNPIWDKISKGSEAFSSPVAIESENNSALIFGSFNDTVYTIPIDKPCTLTAMARSNRSLWVSLFVVFIVFTFVIIPIVIKTDHNSY